MKLKVLTKHQYTKENRNETISHIAESIFVTTSIYIVYKSLNHNDIT